MSPFCSFDSPLSSDIASSDCYTRCLLSGCPKESLNNNQCDTLCNNIECAFDFGECGYCESGCFLSDLQDSSCKAECSNLSCFYDSSVCKECSNGCSHSMLGDGTCQEECNFSICAFDFGDCVSSVSECSEGCPRENLGNKICEEACNVEDCNFDDYDCLCSEECFPELRENEECDETCDVESCGFDSCGDECSTGCKIEMIDNGICEDSCWNKDCGWDGNDCGCFENCKFEDMQNCKEDCLVRDCQDYLHECTDSLKKDFAYAYQMIKGDFRAIASYEECTRKSAEEYNSSPCDETKLANKTDCIEECDIEECGYSWGNCVSVCNYCETCFENTEKGCLTCESNKLQFFTFCLDECPLGYEASSELLCVPVEDTSSLSNPYVYYVDSSNSEFGDGSIQNPFNSLSVALVSTYSEYSILYLNSSVYLDSLPSDYPLSILASSPTDPLNRNSLNPVYLKIEGQGLTTSLTIRSSEMMGFLVNGTVELENLTITSESLDRSCSGSYCNYCGHITCSEGLCLSDKGETVSSYYSKCSDFHNIDLFQVEGLLILKNIEFYDLRMEFNSLIYVKDGGSVEIENTDFTKIRVRSDIKSSVIYSDSEKGTINFTNGNVKLMNDGYEIDLQDLSFNPFIFVKNIYRLKLDSVFFGFNTVYAFDKTFQENFGLISLKFFTELEILNCTFSHNFVPHGIIFVKYSPIPSYTIVNGTIHEMSIDNIVIKDSKFINNYVDTNSAIELNFKDSLQNILVENTEIRYTGTSKNSLISIKSDKLKEEYKEDTYLKVKSGSEYKLGFSKRRTLVFRNVTIDWCFITNNGIFSINNLANILFESSTISNAKTDSFEVDQYVVDYFIQNEESYITEKTNIVKSSLLLYLSAIMNNYNIEMLDTELKQNNIISNQFGFTILFATKATLDGIKVYSNTYYVLGMSLLFLSDVEEITLENSLFQGNFNYGKLGNAGFVVLGTNPGKVSVRNCEFIGNIAYYGSALFVFSYDFLVEDSQFLNNQILSKSGSSITHLIGSNNEQLSGTFRNLNFEGNSASGSSGGAIYIYKYAVTSSAYAMKMSDCIFKSNYAHDYGSAIYINDNVHFGEGSYIRDSNFTNNAHYAGTIALVNVEGNLAIENNNIFSNVGTDAMAIFVSTNEVFSLQLIGNFISSHTGGILSDFKSIDNKLSVYTENCIFDSNVGTTNFAIENTNWVDKQSRFINNVMVDGGGATIAENAHASLQNTVFESNKSTRGGAMYIGNGSRLQCEDCIFRNNQADTIGGALYTENSYFHLKRSEISLNTANEYGSALYIYGKTSETNKIEDSRIYHNLSLLSYTLFVTNTEIQITNITFYENTSQRLLSGIYLYNSILSIDSSEMFNQDSSFGSIIFGTENTLIINNTSFHDIQAYERASILYLSTTTVSILNSTFYNIQAPQYSLFRIDSYSTVLIESSNFDSIYSYNGPNIYLSLSSFTIKNSSIAHFNGTAIYALENDLVHLESTLFQYGNNARALSSLSSSLVLIKHSTFQSITTQGDQGTVYIYSDSALQTSSEIHDNIFSENQATKGGSVYIENMSSQIYNNFFLRNRAYNENYSQAEIDQELYGSGGAIYCKNDVYSHVSISDNTFQENIASLGGGAISWEEFTPVLSSNSYFNNQALYGSDVSSFPVRISPLNSTLEISNVNSGETLTSSLDIALLDHYDQVVKSDNRSECYLEAVSNNTELSGVTKETAKEGIFYFDRFSVVSKPNSTVTIQIVSTSTNSSLLAQIEIRECLRGEITKEDQCFYCSEGTYSLDLSDQECKSCPNNAICGGGDKLGPKKGYWKSTNSSETLIQCPNKDACLGTSSENFVYKGDCEKGYEGNKCQSCENDFYRYKLNLCEECGSNALSMFLLIFYSLMCILVVFCISKVVKFCTLKPASFSVVYVKQFINYLDLLGVIASLEIAYPGYFDQLLSSQRYMNIFSQIQYSAECLFFESDYYYKLIFATVLPLALTIGSLFCIKLYYLFIKRIISIQYSDMLYLLIIVHLLNVGIMKIVVTPLMCTEIEPGEYWILYENAEECWNEDYYIYISITSILGILIWGVLINILLFLYVKKNRNKLYEHRMNYILGFICLGYSRDNYYWEFIITSRKILIVIICVVVELKAIKCISILVVMNVALYLQFKNRPFLDKKLNDLEIRCLTCCTMTVFFGLFFETGVLNSYVYIVLGIFLTLLVVYVLVYLLWKILKVFHREWYISYRRRHIRQIPRRSFAKKSPHTKDEGKNIQFIFAERTVENENYINPKANMTDLFLHRFYHDIIEDRQDLGISNIEIENECDLVVEDLCL